MVFEGDRNKSPGPDGFSLGFFQDNWDIVKKDLAQVFKEFHERGILDSSLSEPFVCLIPKKDRVLGLRISDP